jgi:hypothetical protein
MHAYCSQTVPTIEIERCDLPTCFVEVKQGNIVATWCEDGHFIKGRIFAEPDASNKASRLAKRLQKWIDLTHK